MNKGSALITENIVSSLRADVKAHRCEAILSYNFAYLTINRASLLAGVFNGFTMWYLSSCGDKLRLCLVHALRHFRPGSSIWKMLENTLPPECPNRGKSAPSALGLYLWVISIPQMMKHHHYFPTRADISCTSPFITRVGQIGQTACQGHVSTYWHASNSHTIPPSNHSPVI